MPWAGCEVLGQAVVLISPLALCYAAQWITRLSRHVEECESGCVLRACTLSSLRSVGLAAEPLNQPEVFQYSNATFCYQSNCGCSGDAADGDEDDLDFYIITPQQALGVLGDHAPHFTKIFLNGVTFIADGNEPGTILSVDEYADLMQSTASRIRLTEHSATPSTPCMTPTAQCELEDQASQASDSSPASCRSVSSSASTLLSCSEQTASRRSSLDLPPCSLMSYQRFEEQYQPADGQSASQKGCIEELTPASHGCNPSVMMCAEEEEQVSYERVAAWHCPEMASGTRGKEGGLDSPFGTAAEQLAAAATVASCSANKRRVSSALELARRISGPNPATSCAATRHPGAAVTESTGLLASPGSATAAYQQTPALSMPTPQARPSPRLSPSEKAARRPWVPSGCRTVMSAALAPASKAATSSAYPSTPAGNRPRGCGSEPAPAVEKLVPCCDCTEPGCPAWDEPSVPLPFRAPSLYPRPSLGGVCSSICSSAGVVKAPALPLPASDGSVAEDSIPPALRYYLAQARAAGGQGEPSGGAVVCSDGGAASDLSGSETPRRRQTAAGREQCAAQPGFVRTTVQQLNTRRLVTCHVTPFAAAKTSNKPRPFS